jgi:hypothetical protein
MHASLGSGGKYAMKWVGTGVDSDTSLSLTRRAASIDLGRWWIRLEITIRPPGLSALVASLTGVMGYFSLIAVLVAVVLVVLPRYQYKQAQEFTSGHGPGHRSQPGSLEAHGEPSLPSSVHGPSGPGAFGARHARTGRRLLQVTSQLHDAAQSIIGHAPSPPEHRTEHSWVPQLTLPHAPEPEHLMSQLCACAQSTVPHAWSSLHRIVQS